MVRYRCNQCGAALQSPNAMIGQPDTCPACGNACVVPAPDRRTLYVAIGVIAALVVMVGGVVAWREIGRSSTPRSGDAVGNSKSNPGGDNGATPAPKVVARIRLAAIVNHNEGLIYIPAIEDVQIGEGGKLPVASTAGRKVIGCVNERGKLVGLAPKRKEHRIDGRLIATSTHVIEPIKDKQGADYAAYVNRGEIVAFAARAPDGSERLLCVVGTAGP